MQGIHEAKLTHGLPSGSLRGVWIPWGSGSHTLSEAEVSKRSRAQQNSAEEDYSLQIIPSDRVPLGLKAPAAGNPSKQISPSLSLSKGQILLCHVVSSWEPVPVHSPHSFPQKRIKEVIAHSLAASSSEKLPLWQCKVIQKLAVASHLDRTHMRLCYVDEH